jgi:pimeloyl-ACP methyl ester carboxylesterase
MSVRHCICAALVTLAGSVSIAFAQPPAVPAPSGEATSSFAIFLRGTQVGLEQVSLARTADGWTILSTGRIAAPFDVTARRLEVRYSPEWKPVVFSLDALVKGEFQKIYTTINGTTASSEITRGAGTQTVQKTDQIEPGAILLPNGFFSPYEALAAQLRTAAPGSTLAAYILPDVSLTLRVGDSTTEHIQTAARLITARHTRVSAVTPNVPLDLNIWTDENGRLLELTVPAQDIDVARTDIASVSARHVAISRPNDEPVRIPANGFSLAGTLSRPAARAAGPLPAVVLTGGSGPTDRDSLLFGIPILGQLADALADAGFIVLRYDKRGIGQSGGRAEAASLTDFSEDQRAAVRFLSARKDVDQKRVAVVGHSEGGLVSLLSAAKEKRIAAVVLVATNGVTGADLVLAQQQRALSRSNLSEVDKQARVELQKKINEAAITGKGLDALTPAVRRQIDNAEFQSVLAADPAKMVPSVRQPILIVQGGLDTQVEPSNADRLEALARARKPAAPVNVVKVPGVNHLLVPATTGEVDEYAALTDKHISPAVSTAVVEWLKNLLVP